MAASSLDYIRANTAAWEARRADQYTLARRQWKAAEPTWGIFGVPQSDAALLPRSLEGAHTIEIGCGTAYVSAWLARRGALPVGVDPTPGSAANRPGVPGRVPGDDPTVESHLGHGDWIRLLRENGFAIEDLIELRPPAGARSDYLRHQRVGEALALRGGLAGQTPLTAQAPRRPRT